MLAPSPAAAVQRGIVDYRLESSVVDVSPEALTPIVDEMGPAGLRAKWTRIVVHWQDLEPTAPVDGAHTYDPAYLARLDAVATALRVRGVSVIMTTHGVPEWASDSSLWDAPPNGYAPGYQPFYLMETAAGSPGLPALGDLAAFLTTHFGMLGVSHFEVWNEPNLWHCMYPQHPAADPDLGPRTYLRMLRAFYGGAHSASDDVVVIAGGCSPRGVDTFRGSSPRSLALYLKAHGGAAVMDAYSHHPYTPSGSRYPEPGRPPNSLTRCINLYNLGDLLRIFPDKPFYLTEYGYSTTPSLLFGLTVTLEDQARYLRQAYRYVRRYPQVRALLWYLVVDWGIPSDPYGGHGAYTGLDWIGGEHKPGWYAFAGGAAVTVDEAPASLRATATGSVTGELAWRGETLDAKKVTLQRRLPGARAWRAVTSAVTQGDGRFAFTLSQRRTSLYRVVWDGVCETRAFTVRTPPSR